MDMFQPSYIVAALGSLLVGGFTYWLNDLHGRVKTLEASESAVLERLARIETKMDLILNFYQKEKNPHGTE